MSMDPTDVWAEKLLTWNASGNDADVSSSQGMLESIIFWQVSSNLCDRGDVGEICGNTRSVDNIVESELVNERGGFAEEGQRLHWSVECLVHGRRRITCPIPPEAPRTTAFTMMPSSRVLSLFSPRQPICRAKCGVIEA